MIATVEGQTISLAEYQGLLERRARARHDRFAHGEARRESLDELIKSEAVYVRAKQAGFDKRPEIARQIKVLIVQRFIEEQLKDNEDAPLISNSEIAQYYRTHPARFATPAQVRFAIIEFRYSPKATEGRKREVIERAAAVLAEARAGAASSTFGALAQRHSEDQPTRYQGGDVGWVSRDHADRWPQAVTEAAFALTTPGDLSPVIATPGGCYLVKLIEKKEAGARPLEEVREAIRYELSIKNRHRTQDAFYEGARAHLKIEINHALLNSLPAPAAPPVSATPALPGS